MSHSFCHLAFQDPPRACKKRRAHLSLEKSGGTRRPTQWVVEMKFAAWSVVIATLLISLGVFLWVAQGSFVACVPQDGQTNDNIQRTISSLDGVLEVSLKLSTSLVGVAAALLIGLKSGLSLTLPIRTALLVSTLMFCQSALYAVWWRIGMANNWLNKCPDLVIESFMQWRYEAHLAFFLAGLFSLGILVCVAAFGVRDNLPIKGDTA